MAGGDGLDLGEGGVAGADDGYGGGCKLGGGVYGGEVAGGLSGCVLG